MSMNPEKKDSFVLNKKDSWLSFKLLLLNKLPHNKKRLPDIKHQSKAEPKIFWLNKNGKNKSLKENKELITEVKGIIEVKEVKEVKEEKEEKVETDNKKEKEDKEDTDKKEVTDKEEVDKEDAEEIEYS